MPISNRILEPLQLGDELLRFWRLWRELGRIPRPLHDDAVLMQQFFCDRTCRAYNLCKHGPRDF